MDTILHYLKDPKLWELWHIPYSGSCRILSINRRIGDWAAEVLEVRGVKVQGFEVHFGGLGLGVSNLRLGLKHVF